MNRNTQPFTIIGNNISVNYSVNNYNVNLNLNQIDLEQLHKLFTSWLNASSAQQDQQPQTIIKRTTTTPVDDEAEEFRTDLLHIIQNSKFLSEDDSEKIVRLVEQHVNHEQEKQEKEQQQQQEIKQE